jgi:hypothetical protein
MASIFYFYRRLSGHPRALGYLFLLLAMGAFASCRPPLFKTKLAVQAATLSPEDSLLGTQFPLREDLQAQKELLLKYSKPTERVMVPDGEHHQGSFNHGAIELILDEIDGEPNYFYGHLEDDQPQQTMAFIIYGIASKQLDKLVPGQKYRLDWIETVVNTEPFDDDRYRDFLTYRICQL